MKVRINMTPLHDGQKAIVKSAARFRVARCGRRFGKTLLAVEWLAMMPGGAVDGKPVALFAPTYKLLLEVWAEFEKVLHPIIKKASRSEMRIELITGGHIDCWTLEDENAGRGRRYARVVVDEAAHARYLREAWERAIAPTLTDFRGEAWFISTPSGMNYFYELAMRGDDLAYPDWAAFHMPTTSNPHIPHDEIERARGELPELVFRQEYLADFVSFGAGLVKPEQIIEGLAPPGLPVALGVDLAISEKEGSDWTAIVAVSREPTSGLVFVREVERHRLGFHGVLERIKAAAARWQPSMIAIEQTQFQAAVVQELTRTTSLPIRGIRPDRDKVTRFGPMLTRYEQRQVRHDSSGVPAWFRDEVLSFPQGQHDDAVDALGYAFAALSMGQDSPAGVRVRGL